MTGPELSVSRADLPSEVEERIEEMVAQMAARELLSRADFRRQVYRLELFPWIRPALISWNFR